MWTLYSFLTLLVINTSAQNCEINSDCPDFFKCSHGACIESVANYRSQIAGSILIVLIASLSNAGGVGTGLIVMPVLFSMFRLSVHAAIPMCDVVILGASMIGIGVKILSRDPHRDRPLVMYDLILLIIAPLLLGTILGVVVNTYTPDFVILSLLCLVLMYFSYKNRGRRIFITESQARGEEWDSISMSYESSEEYYITISQQDVRNSEISLQSQHNINDADITEELSPQKTRMKRLNSYLKKRDLARLERIYQSEARIVPYKEFSYILSIYILFGAFSIVNSDRAWLWEIGIERCTRYHIYLLVFFIGLVGILVYFIVKGMYYKTRLKDSLGYDWEERDFKMRYKNMSVICVVSVIAGVCAGMLGMSGGTFLSPLLLSYRIRPELTAATSSFLLFFTSSISTLQFLYIQELKTSLVLILLLSSAVGSLLGITVVNRFIEKHKRASLLVILISIILTISSISMLIYAIDSISSVSFQSLPLSNFSFCN